MDKFRNYAKLMIASVLSALIIFPGHMHADAESNARYLDNIVQISTGSSYLQDDAHTLALDRKGVVWAWGNNFYGQLGDGVRGYKSAAIPVFQDVKMISTSDNNSFALKNDGTVWVWGQATGLQGDGTLNSYSGTEDFLNPTPIQALSDIVEIQSGSRHVLALKSDGTVWTWGNANPGLLGTPEWKECNAKAFTPMRVPGLTLVVFQYRACG